MKLKNLLKEYDYTNDVKHVAYELKIELKNVQNEFHSNSKIMFFNSNWKTLGASMGNGIEPERKGVVGDFFYYLEHYHKTDKNKYEEIIDKMKKHGVNVGQAPQLGYWKIEIKGK
jgi:hypothetical protein